MYTSSDGRAEPFTAVPAIAKAAQKKGVNQKTTLEKNDVYIIFEYNAIHILFLKINSVSF